MGTFLTFTEFLVEGYDLKSLQKNKKSLTAEEREEVIYRAAIWHHGPNGEPSPAVWKTSDSKGKQLFVTNTHRAMAVEKSLKAAINKYHSFIKGTA